jgi:HlyD family type I secretion membrane fusion protein
VNYMSSHAMIVREPEPAFGDSPRREFRFGGAIAALFFGGLLGWAAFIPLDAGAMANGVVAVSGNRQAVQHRDGGIVTHIHVSEGAMVRKGQILLRISASDIIAAERGLTGEIIALLAQRARLLAERDGLGSVPEPAEFRILDPGDRPLAAEALRGQQILFAARRASISTERGVLAQRVEQHREQINGYGAQIAANREQRRLIVEELDGLQSLVSRGFVSINRIRAIERAGAELDGNHGSYNADIARSSEAIGEARLQMVSLERQMMEEVALQLREVQVRLDELQPRLTAAREQIARSAVRAPSSGRVVGLRVFTIDGVVASGEMLMEIVPQDRTLVVEAKASPTDADDLEIGMRTQVRFSGIQERNLPILSGRVSKISADSFEDDRTGMRYFKLEVNVPSSELDKIRSIRGNTGLRAGVPAEVMIPLRERTALSYLMEPLTQSLWRAGREH